MHFINAGDGHQALHSFIGERLLGKIAPMTLKIVGQPIELAQVTLHGQTLISRQDLLGEPGTALGATEILMLTGRDQMACKID